MIELTGTEEFVLMQVFALAVVAQDNHGHPAVCAQRIVRNTLLLTPDNVWETVIEPRVNLLVEKGYLVVCAYPPCQYQHLAPSSDAVAYLTRTLTARHGAWEEGR